MKRASVATAFLFVVCLAVPLAGCGGGGDGEPIPATSRIAFTSDRDGNDEIYVIKADGLGLTRLTDNPEPEHDCYPAWSPDGNRIAFDSDRDNNAEIYVMNADGTDPRNLTNNRASDVEPVWSPAP